MAKVLGGTQRNGGWLRWAAPCASGQGTAAAHVGPGKDRPQIRFEILGKRVCLALAEAHPQSKWVLGKELGWMQCSGELILKTTPKPGRQPAEIYYNESVYRRPGFDRHFIERIVAPIIAPVPEPVRCLWQACEASSSPSMGAACRC